MQFLVYRMKKQQDTFCLNIQIENLEEFQKIMSKISQIYLAEQVKMNYIESYLYFFMHWSISCACFYLKGEYVK